MEPKFEDAQEPKFEDVGTGPEPKFEDAPNPINDVPLPPKPELMSQGDAESKLSAGVNENIRQVKEWWGELPSKIGQAAISAASAVTDIPLSQVYMQEAAKAAKEAAPNLPIPKLGKSMRELAAERGVADDPSQDPIPRELREVPGVGATPGELLNISAQGVIGRPVKLFQDTIGKTLAGGAVKGLKASRERGWGGFNVGSDSDTLDTLPMPPRGALGPDAEELLDRETLSMLGGPSVRFDESDPRYKRAGDQLFDRYGYYGAAFAQSFAREIGGLPLYLINTGAGEWATAGARAEIEAATALGPAAMKGALPGAVSKARAAALASGTIEGQVQGGAQAAAEGGDSLEGASIGGAVGALFGALGAAQAKRQTVQAMSEGLGKVPVYDEALPREAAPETTYGDPGALVPTSSMKELVAQLDTQVEKARTLIPKPAFTADKLKVRSIDKAPQFTDEPIANPTLSYLTINSDGVLVKRDVLAKAQVVDKTPDVVRVESVGKKGGRYVEPKRGTSSSEVTYQVSDTPINAANILKAPERISFNLSNPEALKAYNELAHKHQMKVQADDVGGTAQYMPPSDVAYMGLAELKNKGAEIHPAIRAAILAQQGAKEVSSKPVVKPREITPEQIARSITDTNGAKRQAVIEDTHISSTLVSISPEGHIQTVPINVRRPRSPSAQVERGDTVRLDNGKGGTVVGSPRVGGDVTVELVDGSHAQVPQSSLVLDEATRHQYERKLQGMRQSETPTSRVEPEGKLNMREKAIILSHDWVSIGDLPRMLNRPVSELPAMANEVAAMVKSGSLREVVEKHGVYEPTNRHQDPGDAKPGRFVYFKATESGSGAQGVYRGPDPRKRGNVLIQEQVGPDEAMSPIGPVAANTRFLSLPASDMRDIWPVHMSQKFLADANKLSIYGIQKPMPPGYLIMSDRTNDDMIQLTKMWQRVNNQPGWIQKAITSSKEAFLGPMYLTPPLLRQGGSQMLWGLRDTAKSEGSQRAQTLARGLGGYLSPASVELEGVLAKARSRNALGAPVEINVKELRNWTAKYPKEASEIISTVKAMVAESGELSRYLASRGVGNIDELEVARASGMEPEYLTGMFNAFMMPREEWAKYVAKNLSVVHENAIRYMYGARPDLKPNQVSQELDEIMRMDNPIEGFKNKGYLGGDAKKKLISKVDIPEEIRALLGGHRGAALKLAYTVTNQRQLAKSLQAWDAVAQSPYWSPGPRPDLTLRVPDHQMFGDARNGWTHESLRSILEVPQEKRANGFLRSIGWLGKKWKGAHTVYNLTSHVNNAVRNFKGLAAAGGLTSFEDVRGFSDAAAMMLDYSRDPTTLGPNAPYIEAMDFDALNAGLSGAELSSAQKQFQHKVLREISKSVNGATPIEDVMSTVYDIAHKVPELAHIAYDTTDRLCKFGTYLNLRRKNLASGMDKHTAAGRASMVVNDYFFNPARVPEWVKEGAKHWGLLAPFLTSKIEDMRINATIAARVVKTMQSPMHPDSDPGLLLRLAVLTGTAAAGINLAHNLRKANGITDAHVADAMEQMPLRSQGYRPALVPSLSFDDKGRLFFYDLTPYEDLAMTLRGNVHDEWYMRMLRNNMVDITGDKSVMGQYADIGAQTLGGMSPTKPDQPLRPDQQGLLQFMQMAASGFVPSTITNATSAYDKTQQRPMSPTQEVWTSQEARERALGLPMAGPVGQSSQLSRVMEAKSGLHDAAYGLKQGIKSGIRSGASDDRMKYIINSNVENIKQKAGDFPKPRSLKRRDEK